MRTEIAGVGMRMMRVLVLALLGLGMVEALGAERFSHRFATGDRYRVISTASEDVYFNRRLSHRAEILNRIAFSVEDVRADGAGFLVGEFRTSTKAEGYLTYATDDVYESRYWQNRTGRYEIGPEYFMPVVRHVPTFPDRDLKPGDTWTAPGEERHDFRRDFGIPDPYIIPFDAKYEYVGTRVEDGKTLHEIAVSYAVFHEPPPPRAWDLAYPVRISGYSDQRLFWDAGTGHLERYEETFRFVFDLSSGATVEYRGRAAATVVEAELMDRAEIEADLRDAVKDIPNVTVASDERGVTISLEDLRFVADSTRLLPGEDGKLALIAGILARYPDRDILVTGHTALAGTAEQRAALSLARARAVAERLVALKARTPERVVIEAYGAERPVAPNDSEANMARNRRVEITILEN